MNSLNMMIKTATAKTHTLPDVAEKCELTQNGENSGAAGVARDNEKKMIQFKLVKKVIYTIIIRIFVPKS